MFEFFIAMTFVGLTLFAASLFALAVDWDPFWLWIAGVIISAAMMVVGSAFGTSLFEPSKTETPDIQQEHTEIVNQYNYCPYCGKEINK